MCWDRMGGALWANLGLDFRALLGQALLGRALMGQALMGPSGTPKSEERKRQPGTPVLHICINRDDATYIHIYMYIYIS